LLLIDRCNGESDAEIRQHDLTDVGHDGVS